MHQYSPREHRVFDALLLGHISSSISYFGSATLLVLAGLFGTLVNVNRVYIVTRELKFLQPMSADLFTLYFAIVTLILILSFFAFTYALRKMAYTFALLGGLLPDGALLWAGNSMPVRDLDAWLPSGSRSIRPLSNRGANGIDGVVSTALGAAAAEVGAVTLVVGDVSFLHALHALVAARLHGLSATIVLIENDGGGIFSFLSQATTDAPDVGLPDHYEELFGTPHGIDVGPIVTALGGEYRPVMPSELREALADSIARPGVRVLGFRTDRGRNVELHRQAAAAVADALSRP